jgi:hypothetical protein
VTPHSSSIPAATINSATGTENVVPPPIGVIQAPAATGLSITNGTAAFASGTVIVTVFYSIITLS